MVCVCATISNHLSQLRQRYIERITNFYKYWNPAKLVNPTHVVGLIDKYTGREEELLQTLVQKYVAEGI